MQAAREFRSQRLVHGARAGDAAHALEDSRRHAHVEMRLTARAAPEWPA